MHNLSLRQNLRYGLALGISQKSEGCAVTDIAIFLAEMREGGHEISYTLVACERDPSQDRVDPVL